MTFADPSTPGDRLPLPELVDALLLIEVVAQETGIQTAFGQSDAIRAHVHALDGQHKGKIWQDSLIFPKVLQSQLRSSIGQMVLGRLGKGDAKPGQSAPWKLAVSTAKDRETGDKYLRYKAGTAAPSVGDAPF